jgi:cation:H+ antiporter
MVGVGAIVAGAVRPRRSSLAIEAIVALALLGATAALLLGGLPPFAALAVVLVILVPYVAILVLGDLRVHLLPLPAAVHGVLRDALGGGFSHPVQHPHTGSWWRPIALMTLALAAIVGGATAMVDTSIVVADAIGLSHALDGLLILAVVTSLPNMSTAIRLARQGRGDATVSETLNSNNINLVGGIVIPAVILGLGSVPGGAASDLIWLAVLTTGALAGLASRGGMRRLAGVALVGAYLAFVVAHIF